MNLKKVKFNTNFDLDFGASNQTRTYGFTYENLENDVLKEQIFYETELNFMSDRYGHNCVFEINRKQIFINNKSSYSKIEQIANTAAETIFPIKIKTKINGEIESILNHDEIVKRWSDTRKNILEYYKGDNILKVVAKIDALMLNNRVLQKSINQNWFFHLFFKPLYVSYSEKLSCNFIWESPIFGNQSIKYGVVQSIDQLCSSDDKINITANGIAIDERNISEIIAGYNLPKSESFESKSESVESKMNVDYKLYNEDRSIFSVLGTFETKIDEKTQQKIQLEIYHLTPSSSYRPWSDASHKENQRIFESWQKIERDYGKYDYFHDLSKEIKNNPVPKLPKNPLYTEKIIELFVEEIFPKKKISIWSRIKSVFKKNKEV